MIMIVSRDMLVFSPFFFSVSTFFVHPEDYDDVDEDGDFLKAACDLSLI